MLREGLRRAIGASPMHRAGIALGALILSPLLGAALLDFVPDFRPALIAAALGALLLAGATLLVLLACVLVATLVAPRWSLDRDLAIGVGLYIVLGVVVVLATSQGSLSVGGFLAEAALWPIVVAETLWCGSWVACGG